MADEKYVMYKNGKFSTSDEGGGGSASHTYSSEEQVVGVWTDGKPVYEKTYTTPSFNGSYDIQTGIPFGMAMIVGGYYMLNDNNSMIGLNEWFASANYSFCHAELDGDIRCMLQGYTGVGHIVIRYTKSTD